MDENPNKESIIQTQNNPLVSSQINLINSSNENSKKEMDIDYHNNDSLLSEMFKISDKNDEIIPVLNKASSIYIKKLFAEIPSFEDDEKLYLFILNKVRFFNRLKEIIGISYELLYIIFDYLSFYDLSPFNYFIELYIKYILLLNNNADIGNEIKSKNKMVLLTEIKDVLSWFISCGLLKKIDIDFLYQKIAQFQLYNELSIELFTDLMSLIEIIYGNNCDYKLVNSFISKKYIYLCDKESSKIETNITPNNPINVKKGFTILMWFYLKNHENDHQCTLCQIRVYEDKKVEFVLNKNYDIDIKYNDSTIFKEKDNKIFTLKQKKWTQLKIKIDENNITLYLMQINNEDKNSENEIKTYIITNEKKINERDNKNFIEFQKNFTITSLRFCEGFVGDIGYIIFFNTNSNKNIDSLQLEKNLKIRELLQNENILSEIYFIFDPNFYLYENNKFVYSINNIIGELGHNSTNDQFKLNSVLKFHDYLKNIYYLGGCKNILPLFEAIYKFSTNYNLKENDLITLSFLFQRLIKLMEIIFINKRKNCIEVYKYEISFFEFLKLFLEKINEKFYFNNENSIINSFINIGEYFSSLISQNELDENESYGLFNNILFNPKIIIKFSPESQKKLIIFFIKIQKENNNLLMTIENINKLLLQISKRFYSNYDFNILFDYIKILFENDNTSDNERESLFLLYCNEKLSDEIFIYIVRIFCDYFQIKKDKDKLKNNKETSIKTILSNNFFIENLLYFFSNKNIQIKKSILSFVVILIQDYNTILEEYFNQIEKYNQRNKNEEINERISKEDFFNFIQQNFLMQFTNINENNKSEIKRNNSIVIKSSKNTLDCYTQNNILDNRIKTNLKNGKHYNLNISSNKETIINFNRNRANSEKNNKIKMKTTLDDNFLICDFVENNNEKNNNDFLSEFAVIDFSTNINSSNNNLKADNKLKKRSFISSTSLNLDLIYEKSVSNFSQEVKNLADHCINFILDVDNDEDCNNFLYDNGFYFVKGMTSNYIEYTHKKKYDNIRKSNNIKNYRQKSLDNLNLKQVRKINLNDYDENEEIATQNTKSEILLILNVWLVNIAKTEKNKKNTELINWIVKLLIKLFYNSKELEVIYNALFLILSHKGLHLKSKKTKDKKINDNNMQLLFYFVNNEDFIQLLEEITIYSYIGKKKKEIEIGYNENLLHKFKVIKDPSKKAPFKNTDEFFKIIYGTSYELLAYVLSSKFDKCKNTIINDIINKIIKLSGILKNKEDKILFKFSNKLFLEMYELYHNKLAELKNDIERDALIENYIGLLSIYFNYSLISNLTCYYLNNKSNLTSKMNNIIPQYLISRILYNKEKSDWTCYDIYDKIITDLKIIFSLNEIIKFFGISNNNSDNNNNNTVIKYDSKTIGKLIKCLVENQSSFSVIKKKFEYLFKNCLTEENSIELIYIISLFYNNSLYILLTETKAKEISTINLIKIINDFQSYIIFLILICCNMKEEEQSKQTIIYNNLIYSIRSIVLRVNNNSYGQNFIDSFCNILNVISKIYLLRTNNINSIKKMFTKNINLENTAAAKLIDYFIKLDDDFFSKKNFTIFAENMESGVDVIKENKELLFSIFSNSNSFEINNKNSEYISITFKKFDDIYNEKLNITKKIKFLIDNKNIENNDNEEDGNYKNLFLKINKLKTSYNTNKIKNFQRQCFAINNYKKLKKSLYSFNNSYSNLSIFYPDKIISYPNKKNLNKLLKYKVSNFLSKDMSRKFLSPIIDIKNYVPNFRCFDYQKNNIYHHSKDKMYCVDLNIFTDYSTYPFIPNSSDQSDSEKYFIIENICYIKTTHHVSGIIFIEKNDNSCFYFCIKKLETHNILVSTKPDYDCRNKSCFGSLFRNNRNKKDKNVYFKIDFKDINFIFNRKYCFRDNSIEIFLNNNRSYYFKFESKEKRIIFIEYILNILNKKLFKPIKSIDRNDKPITLGYYKDIEHNKEYSNIEEIKKNWKNNKISTLEYLMWINIYGNRSFRDLMQYPIFPWLLIKYDFNTAEELYKNLDNIKRNFNIPLGLLALDDIGKKRRQGYINCYKTMINNLIENDYDIENDYSEDNESSSSSNSNDNNKINDNNTKKENKLIKIPKYKFKIEDLFFDKNLEIELIPYFYGSHYSAAMYVSHFLMRLFPYSLTMIEIQSNGFDAPDRLFLSLKRTFKSVVQKKGDLRELIPEFFTIPELFINLNRFNFGKVNINDYKGDLDEMAEIEKNYINKENEQENKINDNIKNLNEINTEENWVNVEDVIFPKWCSKNPFFFIQKYREFLEKSKIDINPWIDLIFGCCQRGQKAQNAGNIYLSYTYDGVIENRFSEEDILKDRDNIEYQIKLFELGVNPTKVFSEKLKESKKKMEQIPIIGKIYKQIPSFNINQILNNSKVLYIKNINNSFNDIFIIDDKFSAYEFIIKNANDDFIKDSFHIYKDIKIKKIIEKNPIFGNLIIKTIFNAKIIILAGFYDGSVYIINGNMKSNYKENNYFEISEKLNDKNKSLINLFGKGLVTTLEISKDEKYLVYGTNKGTLTIFSLDFYSNNNQIDLLKLIPSHIGFKINSIYVNSDLNVFGDCAYDGYVHLYTLPNCKLINSIYIKNYFIDHIFLSAQPLASIILYSDINNEFKCYNINGHDLKVKESDKYLLDDVQKIPFFDENMTTPIVFTDYQFIDFLLYILGNRFIILRKMPLMDFIYKIKINPDSFLSMINLSLCKKYIYAVEKGFNKIYIIETKKNN